LNKRDIRKKIGNKIKWIRGQYDNKNGRDMTQQDFAELFNQAEPVEITMDAQSLGKYERGDVSIPGDKYEKILSLAK